MRWWTFIGVLAMVAILQGCYDDSYPGSSSDDAGADAPVSVLVEVGDPVQNKSSVVVENIAKEGGRNIYVYAFNRDMLTSFEHKAADDGINTLIDGSVDQPGTKAGRRALTRADGGALVWPDASEVKCYHSGELKNIPYEFYAYHTGELRVEESQIVRTEDAVRFNLEIDGSQDLMTAKAELTEDQLEGFGEDEQKKLSEYSYSYYSGSQGVLPRFYFKHHLVRLDFELLPGFVAGEVKDVTVQAVEVESKYKCVFTVADKSRPSQQGVAFSESADAENYRPLNLREKDGSAIKNGTYRLKTLSSQSETPRAVPMSGSLLVAPQKDSLTAYVTMKQTRPDGSIMAQARSRVTLKYARGAGYGSFDAGNRYKVKLQIFGVNTVNTTVDVEPWLSGGNASLDGESDKPEL